MTQESEQDTIYDSSSSSTIAEQSDYYEEITNLRTEFIALKSFVMEKIHFIKQRLRESFKVKKNSHQENYISRLLKDINYLKQENKTKSSIIQSIIQSGNTNNYDNDNITLKVITMMKVIIVVLKMMILTSISLMMIAT